MTRCTLLNLNMLYLIHFTDTGVSSSVCIKIQTYMYAQRQCRLSTNGSWWSQTYCDVTRPGFFKHYFWPFDEHDWSSFRFNLIFWEWFFMEYLVALDQRQVNRIHIKRYLMKFKAKKGFIFFDFMILTVFPISYSLK